MLARHDVTEARGGLHLHLVALLGQLILLVIHARASLVSAFGQFLQSAALLNHSQHSQPAHAKAPGGLVLNGPGPYLAQTMLNFLHLGKSRFLLMLVVLSLTHYRSSRPPQISTPTRPPNPIAIAPHPSTCRQID